MKTILALLVAGPFLMVPDLALEAYVAQAIADFRMAVEEPVLGEPARVSKLRNEMSEEWDRLLGSKLILDLEE